MANVPSASEVDATGKIYEMLFVMRSREGMTQIVASQLAKSPTGSMELLMSVEGPYATCVDTEQFNEILFVAGGSGISHIMSSEDSRKVIIHQPLTFFSACLQCLRMSFTRLTFRILERRAFMSFGRFRTSVRPPHCLLPLTRTPTDLTRRYVTQNNPSGLSLSSSTARS
jgi:hypothetical protein